MKTLLIVGCGDVMTRALPWLVKRVRVLAAVRDASRAAALRALGAVPLRADLDDAASLTRLAGVARWVIHSAPPADQGATDLRTARLVAALSKAKMLSRGPAARWAYISTSGVYGDCHGEVVSEARGVAPATLRAKRRVDAEGRLRAAGRAPRRASFVRQRAAARLLRRPRVQVSVLRAPGIYAADRLPLARLQRGDPVLRPEIDVFTNHIHADDLGRLVWAALFRARGGRAFNASDNSALKMGEYFDLIADACQLPRPPRVSREEAAQRLSPMTLSFMSESRRLSNARIRRELGVALKFPTVQHTLAARA
jgi:nucleoside-diphosphate-sugar epimerase